MKIAPLQKVVRPTTIIESRRLSTRLGMDVFLATETFQHSGSFKFRAGYNVAANVPQRHLIAASSGNFGQGLVYSCQLLGKRSTIVMPHNSAQVKVDAVRELGGDVDLVDVRTKTRKARVEELAAQFDDVYVASAYDDPLVISGNASLGVELGHLDRTFDCVIASVGGGGLTSGLIEGIRSVGRKVELFGAEPLLGNDAARSLRAGRIVALDREPETLADGARTLSIGQHNWALLKDGLAGIVEVPEEQIVEGVRLLFTHANLKAEPTGALGIGALLTEPERFRGRRVCCVISGGNVDPELFRKLIG